MDVQESHDLYEQLSIIICCTPGDKDIERLQDGYNKRCEIPRRLERETSVSEDARP